MTPSSNLVCELSASGYVNITSKTTYNLSWRRRLGVLETFETKQNSLSHIFCISERSALTVNRRRNVLIEVPAALSISEKEGRGRPIFRNERIRILKEETPSDIVERRLNNVIVTMNIMKEHMNATQVADN